MSEKLAIGLTLTNKLTRFSCDAEYQSPPEPACARSFLLAGMESNDDDDDDDGTNREQQVRSCSALPITAHVLSGTCPATIIRCSTAASDCNTHSPPSIANTPLNPFLTPFSMQLQSPQMNCNFKPRSKVCNENEQIAEILAAATRRRRRSKSRREREKLQVMHYAELRQRSNSKENASARLNEVCACERAKKSALLLLARAEAAALPTAAKLVGRQAGSASCKEERERFMMQRRCCCCCRKLLLLTQQHVQTRHQWSRFCRQLLLTLHAL